ncbi:SKI-like proto-oncogene b [Brachyhypopomus gauderio]|uniref:SKI-like proto-oncogene b n=1 Tax=Brachyhypopomus gauderio TaxID=698409 RepID=UPI00404360EB
MAVVQNNRTRLDKDQALLRAPLKRLMRERPVDTTPIKKRVMAALNLSCRKVSDSSTSSSPSSLLKLPIIKTEQVDKDSAYLGCSHDPGYQQDSKSGRDSVLDLSPALRHTLAQFTLSSQCSLGGPAAFSGQHGLERLAPLLSQGSVTGGPLLVPPDSSTELALCSLQGESISCFSVGGELRLCLPQVLNTVLRDFSLQQINSVCDQLYVYCSRCDGAQLHVLKAVGVLPPGAPSCGLITLTDAQRLCNTLLHPGDAALAAPPKDLAEDEEREREEGGGFWVEHRCLGKCQGLFEPRLYTEPRASCIRCSQCRRHFCPERFVMHSHRQPDKRTCHWGFDSAMWPRYLQLGRRYQGTAEEVKLQALLEGLKTKFHSLPPETKQPHLEAVEADEGLNLCSGKEKLCESGSEGKAVPLPAYVFDPCLLASVKEDPSQLDLVWRSWYLYMHDKMSGPSIQSSACVAGKGVETLRAEMLGSQLHHGEKQTDGERLPRDGRDGGPRASATAGSRKTTSTSQSRCDGPREEWQRVSADTAAREKTCGSGVEETKDGVVAEVLQLYGLQHEKLQATHLRQRQLEKELQVLRRDEAAEQVAAVAARGQKEAQKEQRLPGCRCKEQRGGERQQDSRYAAQLSELRQRLDRAEEDREELQEELRREREAREKLERTIAELKQQMKESVPISTLDSPLSNSSSDTLMSLAP